MPPSRYLGLRWPDWCDTDILLDRAVAAHDERLCSCGCGHWSSETQGDDFDGEWAVEQVVCHARAAMDQALAEMKDRRPDGLLLYTRPATNDD